MSRETRYRFTAQVQLLGTVADCDCKTGAFTKLDSENEYGWVIMPTKVIGGKRTVDLSFCAWDSIDAIAVLNRIMQREARGRPSSTNKREKRQRYRPSDYRVLSLLHPATGETDLPAGANQDCSPRRREKGPMNTELAFT